MRTLALGAGERSAVVAAEWRDAFDVVTRGRVQLELRDGQSGSVLGRAAGFWLRGIGVAARATPAVARRRCASSPAEGQDRHMPVSTPRTPLAE
ncbi:hypothetical protein AB0F68_13105 [Micromonospora sp. NPDC023966]|uniref:hypothetical protein n=1 Tax=Micromonospora sp. NPDC023966 TaxID=3154699 RepID=UPI0033E30618